MPDHMEFVPDIASYASTPDEAAVKGIVRHCGIALQNRDSSFVAMTDKSETARVRDNFLKKKLGLTQSDEELDAAIEEVAAKMTGDKTKHRVTVYYLLAEKFGKLDMFK